MKLLNSIEGDMSQLEERSVLNLMDALRKVHALSVSPLITRTSANHISSLHKIVCEMASENEELVDGKFCLEYL